MELVGGETLAERVAQGPIPTDEAIPLFIQIAEGLEAAHEKRIIHRDLKPANIKIGPDGKPKTLDFGLESFSGVGRHRIFTRTRTEWRAVPVSASPSSPQKLTISTRSSRRVVASTARGRGHGRYESETFRNAKRSRSRGSSSPSQLIQSSGDTIDRRVRER